MYYIIDVDSSYIILRKHSVTWSDNAATDHFETLNSQKNPRSQFVLSRLQNAWILKRQNCLQIRKFAPSKFQNDPQSNAKSIKYPSLIQSKTDSDFGLLITFPFHKISLDLIAQMPSKYGKF